MSYRPELIEKANKFGFKTANLDELTDILKELPKDNVFSVDIPAYIGIEDEIIKLHLDKHTNGQWRNIWQEFIDTFKKQKDQTSLGKESLEVLEKLGVLIKKCFNEHPLPKNQLDEFLDKLAPTDLLMIRSTGKEDSTEQANPGGNDSIACVEPTIEAISNNIGKVVASYVGEKSLSQRLKAKDNIIQDLPFMPILNQKMIGEKINNEKGKANIYSGVIYTSTGCTNIQMAPGHGELIVNSKGNFDNIYISQDGMTYFENMKKLYRLAPTSNKDNPKKIELEMVPNDLETRNKPSADRELATYLHYLSKAIEKKYGMRMDIEFIYDAANKKISIVQARPIPLGDRRNLQPSAISPKHIVSIQKNNNVQKANVITPETLRAAIIQNKNQILIYQTIGEALDAYLKMGEDHNNIKAVIIKEPSASNSHEAGEFSSKAIPVLQALDYNAAREMVDNLEVGKALVIDPQRKCFVMLDGKNEKELYESGIIENGIFRSPLSPYVSPINFDFSKNKLESTTPQELSKVMDEFSNNHFYYSEFVKAAENNQTSIDKLSSYLFGILNLTKGAINFKDVMAELDVTVPNISFGTVNSNQEQKNAISKILRFVNIVTRKLTTSSISKQIMITGGELYLLLERAEKQKYSEKLLLEYLNIYEKFSGLITSYGKKDTFSNSLISELADKKFEDEFTDSTLSNDRKNHLAQLSKFEKYLLNAASKSKWYTFIKNCENPTTLNTDNLKALMTMMSWLESNGIAANWINSSFIKSYSKHNGNIIKIISEELKECGEYRKNSAEFDKASMYLLEMENQIPLFKEPDKFTKLFAELETKINILSKILQYNGSDSEIKKMFVLKCVHQLVDILDRSIKSLEKSTLYDDKHLQINRFYKLLYKDYELMSKWVSMAGFENQFRIKNAMHDKASTKRTDELSPTAAFTTDKYNIVATQNECSQSFSSEYVTLEDIFTLIHQNLLLALGALSKTTGIQNEQYPTMLKMFDDKLANDTNSYDVFYKGKCDLISCDFSYPTMSLHYNIPLGSHSASIALHYNVNDKTTRASCSFLGEDDYERWEKLQVEVSMIAMQLNWDIKLNPKCNNSFFSFDFNIKDKNEIDFVRSLITYCARRTCNTNVIFNSRLCTDSKDAKYNPNPYTLESLNIIMQDLLSMQKTMGKKDNTNDVTVQLKQKYETQLEKIMLEMNSIYSSMGPDNSNLFQRKALFDIQDSKVTETNLLKQEKK